jgi:hypothetical protein
MIGAPRERMAICALGKILCVAQPNEKVQVMPHYEYRLLEVRDKGWDKLQDSIDRVAKEGFRYRDTIQRNESSAVLIFERETRPEASDAWSAARATMNRPQPAPARSKGQQDERKYPPEEDE